MSSNVLFCQTNGQISKDFPFPIKKQHYHLGEGGTRGRWEFWLISYLNESSIKIVADSLSVRLSNWSFQLWMFSVPLPLLTVTIVLFWLFICNCLSIGHFDSITHIYTLKTTVYKGLALSEFMWCVAYIKPLMLSAQSSELSDPPTAGAAFLNGQASCLHYVTCWTAPHG